mmetsp:Transcript_42714/g.100268  ORF Transcript_42714/g.100268 Transcript_42714/m.100268 type:complete len:95 (-) Transcript_42714:3027-3311(-)
MAHAWRSTMDEQGGVIHSMFVVPWSNHPRFVQYSGLMAATQGGNTNEDENEGTPAPRQAIAIKKIQHDAQCGTYSQFGQYHTPGNGCILHPRKV